MSVTEQNFRWKQKCAALFSGAVWTPRVGDYCTPRDPSLRLFRVEAVGLGGLKLRLVFDPAVAVAPRGDPDVPPGGMAWVPDFILGTGERDRPRIAAEAEAALAGVTPAESEPDEAPGVD
jgi:hypothetical protein